MPAANRIYLQVQFDSQSAEADIDKLNKNIQQIGTSSEEATKKASRGMQSVSVSVHSTVDEMAQLARAIAALGIARGFKELIAMGDEWNRLVRQFGRLGLTSQLRELEQLADRAGLAKDAVAKMANELFQFGTPADQLVSKLQKITDTTAKFGLQGVRGTEAFVEALTKLSGNFEATTKGIQEFARAADVGLPRELVEELGKMLADMKAAGKEIDPKNLSNYLVERLYAAGARGTAVAEATQSVEAAQKRLQNQVVDTAAALDKQFGPAMIKTLDFMSRLLDLAIKVIDIFGKLPEPIKSAIVFVGALTSVVVGLGLALSALKIGFGTVAGIKGALAGVGAAAGAAQAGRGLIGLGLGGAAEAATGAAVRRTAEAAAKVAAEAAAVAATKAATVVAAKEAAKEAAKAVTGLTGEAAGAAISARAAAKLAAKEAAKEAAEAAVKSTIAREAAKTAAAAAGGAAVGAAGRAAVGAAAGAAAEVGAAGIVARVGALIISVFGSIPAFIALVVAVAAAFIWDRYVAGKVEERKRQAYKGPEPESEAELARRRAGLFRIDPEEAKRQVEESLNALAEAQARNLKAGKESIAALLADYEQFFRKVRFNEEATANYRKALWQDVGAEIKKQQEEARREVLKTQREIDKVRLQLIVSFAEQMPDDTYAGRIRSAQVRSDVAKAQARADAEARKTEAGRLLESDLTAIEAAGKKAKQSNQEIEKAKLARRDVTNDQIIEIERLLNIDLLRMTYDFEGAKNAIILEKRKQRAEEDLSDAVAIINRRGALESASESAIRAQTLGGRLGQIQRLAGIEQRRIEQQRDAELDAANEYFRQYRDEHAANEAGIAEEQEKLIRQTTRITLNADTAIQLARISGWKEADQAILEEQQQMFERFKGFFDEMWDAVFDKTKSVWSAIGNVIKNTMLGVVRNVVTNSLAAQFSGIFGGYQTQFPRGIWRGPWFPGGGAPPPITAVESGQSSVTYGNEPMANREIGRDVSQIVTDAAQEEWAARTGGGVIPSGGGYTGGADVSLRGGTEIQGIAGPTGIRVSGGGARFGGFGQSVQSMRDAFGIGKPAQVRDPITGALSTKPWSQLTARQKLGAIVTSKGMGSILASVGLPTFLSTLQRRGVRAGLLGIGSGALTGVGAALMFGLGTTGMINLGVAGAGIGLLAAGWKRGGVSGLAMSIGGGALAGAGIGATIGMFAGPLGAAAGAVIGAAVGAIAGGIAGVVRLFHKTKEEEARQLIRQTYGIDISDRGILAQVAEIANQRYNGNVRMAVHSLEVQDMVRLYSLMTGQNPRLPREMYPATFAQSAGGGLQLQPVYSGGRLIASPYTGVTSTQVANALSNPRIAGGSPVFMQLNPQQATSLFAGQVVQVMGNYPGAVSFANTVAARSGQGRTAQAGALFEPATVMA